MRGIIVMAVLMAACSAAPRAVPRQSEAMETSARLLQKLDQLEADLHESNAETDTYAELVERHQMVTQIACKVTDEHVQEIHRLDLAQQKKRQEKLRKRHALAQLTRASRMD